MLGILYFLIFEAAGIWMIRQLLPRVRPVARGWLGLSLGLVLMMWLPALFAFVMKFSIAAHVCALVLLALLAGGAYFVRDQRKAVPFEKKDRHLLGILLMVALPLTLLGGYLQHTHILRPEYGNLYVGQSTYGDLPLHLAITASLRNASFPADYSILPGARLSYPFLADSLSTSFLMMGLPLRWAMIFPGTIMMGLTFSGYLILAERMAEGKKAAILATLFFFLNGGLGFIYLFDMQGRQMSYYVQEYNFYSNRFEDVLKNEMQHAVGLWERIEAVLNGWYQTPVNHTEFTTYNLRWSNVIADMMIPQRTTLGGWCQLLPCIYLLYDSLIPQRQKLPSLSESDGPVAVIVRRQLPYRQVMLLGIWAGMLPMINTHCFLALGLLSGGWMAYDLLHCKGQRKAGLIHWGIFGGLAVLVAAPQLFIWTFRQSVGNAGFLNFRFNWVNTEQGYMLDGYIWFWLKNIGLPLILIVLSLLEKNPKRRFLASGAFVIFLVAEFIQFQPNPYDNNKLFYIWYMICCVLAADYAMELLGRLKGLRARPVIAALCAFVCFFSGTLSIAREVKSNYQMFSQEEVEAAAFIEENTPEHATFLTHCDHINFVSSLAGRDIVCGPGTWLNFHGFDLSGRQEYIKKFFADPVGNENVLSRYSVDYILISERERSNFSVDEYAIANRYDKVYESKWGDIAIYRVGEAEAE